LLQGPSHGPTYFAWFVLVLLAFVVVGLVVWIGSLPAKIASRRNHPQADAINALSWLGLLFGGVGWAIALVWALYRPSRDNTSTTNDDRHVAGSDKLAQLQAEIDSLKEKIARLEASVVEAQSEGEQG
jgi:uncharacterized iron-regulated membrane protein